MAFNDQDLIDLKDFLNESAGTVPYIAVSRDQAFPGEIAIRHDVDHSIEKAHRFAHWEYERNFMSTYFILTTAPYYDDPALAGYLDDMISWGHEIGFHNDALCAMDGDIVAAAGYIEMHKYKIEQSLSKHYSLLGIADHGGHPFPNGDIWNHYTPQDLGFEYEAYQLQKTANTYISDNQGTWRSPLKHAQTYMLVHPTWWPV
jgi:hypothetical protein